ncbi:MAG: hypothetical protein JST79_21335 [Acidobacteria bacterium]|jgi:hypothetical protein|nr:hypothetical protein [Acidobacteriota bacterium]
MFTLNKQIVLGALKSTGSKDPDVLYAKKSELIQMSKGMRGYSWIPMICGVLLCITIIGAFIGIPALIVGIWLRMKANKNLKLADEALAEYLQSLGIQETMTQAS